MGPTSKGRGGEEREKRGGERRGKGEREGRKGNEEGPTKNSCRGAQNVKLRHCAVGAFSLKFSIAP